ncbi:MAG TPA: ABC transporter permease [Haliangiales bacterium]|nr:ABC transporter permease [Haliangiales bacterium]
MRVYLTLVRRELGAFFVSLTGYVIIASVLLLLGLCFTDMLAKLNDDPQGVLEPMTELFYSTWYFWLILLLTAPVITMRSFAFEKWSGTFETLMTTPVSDWQVVLAKFTGTLLFYVLTWLPLFGCIAVVRYLTREPTLLDPWTTASTFFGIVMIGCLYMSMGCFASALTRSQIMAAMISFVIGLGLFILSLRRLVPAPSADWAARVFSYISLSEHMEDFVRGFVDTRHVVFYLSLMLFFLFLTLKVVESRRWK